MSGVARLRIWVTVAASALAAAIPRSAELTPEQTEFFETTIRPILVERCYKCHSVESGKSKAGLLLDSRDALLKGGDTGPALVPGDPAKSLLLEAVRYTNEDLQMPPKDEGGKLGPEQIAALEQWIKLGAPDPRTGGKPHPMDITAARQHWAFQPVVKSVPPAVKAVAWLRTPVDNFVLAQLEAKGIAPAKPSDARTLLRRVTYDLTGLPPTPEEMENFVRDFARAPRAYDRAVDRLLASPHYGERWGRFWLDVARYADTQGYLVGNAERRFAFAFTYRDYVVRAFNDDKPYDRFIVEQLAADRLSLGEDKSALAALGFLTLGRRFLGNQNDIIDDRIDVVTRGLMGLTVTCARCHDHKFDPVPTKDYYSLHGVFASTEEPAEKPLLGPLIETPAYRAFLEKKAVAEAKVKERAQSEVDKFLTGLREKAGDYLLGAHDAAMLRKNEKLDLFAGPRKLNVEVLKRWQTFLDEPSAKTNSVLMPWFSFAALPADNFAGSAATLVAKMKEEGGGKNRVVREAFTVAEKTPASLKEVAGIYNAVFAATEKSWRSAMDVAMKALQPPPTALPDPAQEAVRAVLYADKAPTNLTYESAATMIKRQIDTRVADLRREVEALNWTEPGAPLRAMALVDKAQPVNSKVLHRGNPANRGSEAPRQFLEILSSGERKPFTHGSGRLDLAEAIAQPTNPLTARVFVNRVWGWHFGAALVRTPSDFGVRTEAPLHRALLDWLAASFVEGGWSVKTLHRTILLSATYRQSAEERPAATALDPDNQLVHRFNRRRLEFEALRDTLLAVAGTLDPHLGGLPEDLTKPPFPRRRTLYGFIDRQNLPGIFRTFDFPNPDTSSAQRFATTVPQQALFLMNSPLAQEQARQLMRRDEITRTAPEADKLRALYRVLFQRRPDDEELKLARDFLHRPAEATIDSPQETGGWSYGYGAFDAATGHVRGFQPMSARIDGKISPTGKVPDKKFGRLSVSATGGFPGPTVDLAGIRRWTAPAQGTVRIEGTFGHASPSGDGVRGRIVVGASGPHGEWVVLNRKVETKVETLRVAAGETIDFIVDAIANANSDNYTWAPTITFSPASGEPARTWSAKKDFENPVTPAVPLTRWEELAQVLLLSNELVFLD